MAEQVHSDNEKRKNWRLEYEQIIAAFHNYEIIELGIAVFIIPVISWGLMLESGGIFCLQDIRIIGIISIGIWLIYVICVFFVFFRKVKRLLDRANVVWNRLNGDNNDENTHISILRSFNLFNHSLVFKLIGFAVCSLWIWKYKLLYIFIYLVCVFSIYLIIHFFLLKKLRKVKK